VPLVLLVPLPLVLLLMPLLLVQLLLGLLLVQQLLLLMPLLLVQLLLGPLLLGLLLHLSKRWQAAVASAAAADPEAAAVALAGCQPGLTTLGVPWGPVGS
jgi:hypothetical protein